MALNHQLLNLEYLGVSYPHVPDNKHTKLDNKSLKCVLSRIIEGSKAYRLYDPLSQNFIISHDVIFKEEDSWPWSEDHAEAIQASLKWGDIDDDNTNSVQDVQNAENINNSNGNETDTAGDLEQLETRNLE